MNIETANRLLQYRKKMNLSQEELASRIGVSRQAVSKWERAEASPDTDNLILLADIYGVSLDELLKGEKETESETQSEEPENNSENNPDSDTTYKKSDKVSFKHGIHVDSKDGDSVHLNFRDGIHVKDKDGTKVDVGWDGIHVEENGKTKVYTDENGNVMYDESIEEHKPLLEALSVLVDCHYRIPRLGIQRSIARLGTQLGMLPDNSSLLHTC